MSSLVFMLLPAWNGSFEHDKFCRKGKALKVCRD